MASAVPAVAANITGAGATFPYPIYSKWAEAYRAKTGVGLNYQSIGSGGGIKQILAKTVDFGASDAPLEPAQLEKDGLVQFPMVMGGVVPVFNIDGIKPGGLRLSGAVLADIYLGKISKWNAPAIAALNQGVKLPDQDITVVARSDGSGTTFIFTQLPVQGQRRVERQGRQQHVGQMAGRRFRQGQRRRCGLRAAPARLDRLRRIRVRAAEQDGVRAAAEQGRQFRRRPTTRSFRAAAANAQWDKAPGFYLLLTDQPGKESWPITGATFILMHKKQDKPENAAIALKFFDWAYEAGDKLALDLDYVPMPDSVVKLVKAEWKKIQDASGKPVAF